MPPAATGARRTCADLMDRSRHRKAGAREPGRGVRRAEYGADPRPHEARTSGPLRPASNRKRVGLNSSLPTRGLLSARCAMVEGLDHDRVFLRPLTQDISDQEPTAKWAPVQVERGASGA